MSLLTGKASDFLKIGVVAAGRGDMDTVRAVLAERPDWIARTGSRGRTMLWEAAYRGRASMVEYLLDRGADIDARGCHFTPFLVHISPYCAARFKRHDDVADRLLQRGARLDVYAAAYLGQLERVREYLDSEPGLPSRRRRKTTPTFGRQSCTAQSPPDTRTSFRCCCGAARIPVPMATSWSASASGEIGTTSLNIFSTRPRSLDIRTPAFRRDQSRNTPSARKPGRRVQPRPRRGRLAHHCLPVARRPRRRCPPRARSPRPRRRCQRPKPQGTDSPALRRQGGIRRHRGGPLGARGRPERRRRRGRNTARERPPIDGQESGWAP